MPSPIATNNGPTSLAMKTAAAIACLHGARRDGIIAAARCNSGPGMCWQWKGYSCPFAGMTRIRFKGFSR
jgi:hypothetical protein